MIERSIFPFQTIEKSNVAACLQCAALSPMSLRICVQTSSGIWCAIKMQDQPILPVSECWDNINMFLSFLLTNNSVILLSNAHVHSLIGLRDFFSSKKTSTDAATRNNFPILQIPFFLASFLPNFKPVNWSGKSRTDCY